MKKTNSIFLFAVLLALIVVIWLVLRNTLFAPGTFTTSTTMVASPYSEVTRRIRTGSDTEVTTTAVVVGGPSSQIDVGTDSEVEGATHVSMAMGPIDELLHQSIERLHPYVRAQDAAYFPVVKEALSIDVESIKVENESLLTTQELESFRDLLAEEIWGYHSGDGSLILGTVLKGDYEIVEENLANDRYHPDVLANWEPEPDIEIPTSPEEIMRRSTLERNGGQNGSGWAGAIDEFSPESSSINVRITSEAIPSLFEEMKSKYPESENNTLALLTSPHVRYKNSFEKVLEDYGEVKCIDMVLPVIDNEKNKYSRVERYYWSPADEDWRLLEAGRTLGPGRNEFTKWRFF